MKEIWMKNDEQRIMNDEWRMIEGWLKDDWRMIEGWWRMMKDEWRMNEGWWRMNDEWRMMMISSCWGVLQTDRQTNGQTNKRTDIGDCRVAFATENNAVGALFQKI